MIYLHFPISIFMFLLIRTLLKLIHKCSVSSMELYAGHIIIFD